MEYSENRRLDNRGSTVPCVVHVGMLGGVVVTPLSALSEFMH